GHLGTPSKARVEAKAASLLQEKRVEDRVRPRRPERPFPESSNGRRYGKSEIRRGSQDQSRERLKEEAQARRGKTRGKSRYTRSASGSGLRLKKQRVTSSPFWSALHADGDRNSVVL